LQRLGEVAFAGFLRLNHWLNRPHCCGANVAVRRAAFFDAGGFRAGDGEYYETGEDVQLGLKLARLGSVRYDPGLVVETSPRHLRSPRYLAARTRTYWQAVWLGRVT